VNASAAPGVSAIQPGLPLPATSSPYHHWLLTLAWPAAAVVVPSWPAAGRLAAAREGRRAGGAAGRWAPKEASGGISLVRGVSHLVRGRGRGRARGEMRLVSGAAISRLHLAYISPTSRLHLAPEQRASLARPCAREQRRQCRGVGRRLGQRGGAVGGELGGQQRRWLGLGLGLGLTLKG